MKTLHSIPREKTKFDWKKLKIPDWTLRFQELGDAARISEQSFNTFRNYYINYPASGVYVDGVYAGDATGGTINIPTTGTHYISYTQTILNDNPVAYWRLGDITSGAV